MDLGIKGKTAIVTGAASNIGRGIALTLAGEGANVVIADIDEEGAKLVAKECEAKGVKALPIKTDVTNQENVNAMVKQAADTFGTIDILVNDAAIFITKAFMDTTKAEWDKQINVNYYGTIYCSRAVLDYMKKQGSGRIISVGSDAGRVGENRQTVYSGTKGAVIAFSKALCLEVGRYGVTVNVVCPGATLPEVGAGRRGAWVNLPTKRDPSREDAMLKLYPMSKASTETTPARFGIPEDVANVVAFYASKQAYFITGQVLSASGGYTRAG
ncbi:MAG: SDR family NAD(P)-dependent oxidoreductase [Chloroflexi bacterium]|nr:SDR family NAD(P)-dependent oxidoreductase [Chloroflexota bacterium]